MATYDLTDANNFVTLTNMLDPTKFTLSGATLSGNEVTYPAGDGVQMVSQTGLPAAIANHQYYGRCYYKAPNDFTYADGRFEYYQTDGASSLMNFGYIQPSNNEWARCSGILSLASPTSGDWILRSFVVNGSAIAYRKEMMIIDLTLAYGAGNEPTQAWCDANIPYFVGTYNIPKFSIKAGDILNCPYSGAAKALSLKKGIYKLEVWGAQGGSYSSTYYGGKGGYSVGTLTLTDDLTKVYMYAGQQNNTYGSSAGGTSGVAFNGGGYGTTVYYSSTYTYSLAGGGGSDIRIGEDSLYARVIVAGGGSGSTNGSTGYYGGGTTSGGYDSTYQATQTAAGSLGSFGVGGNCVPASTNYKYASAGGGGGWYGGGSYTGRSDSASAYRTYHGGGSGYVYTSTTATNYPTGCLLNENYYLTDASTTAGNVSITDYDGTSTTGHAGNGACRITVIETSGLNIYLGSLKIDAMFLGTTEITGAFLGSNALA